ncbi:hypothetical protein BD410DRAFT_783231 [Rickenella mellea]|uniref:Beta-glucuronidase C-terminal domain-containing protein n=1 Tax=Rickenella mellea TaxID=50990 RepID=A0A4Y7QJK0_9AGAM|nr:hypothetical protein BD410DRAFT_783231 [Rickenella mellea]
MKLAFFSLLYSVHAVYANISPYNHLLRARGAAADDKTILNPPPVPNPAPPKAFNIQLQSGGAAGLSIKHDGSFLGFSIEFSVSDQVIGKSGNNLNTPFLNLMANIKARAGKVVIRVGGNSQENATLVPSLAPGVTILKNGGSGQDDNETPSLSFTPDLLYAMSNVSSLTNAKWYFGIPFLDLSKLQLNLIELAESTLGSNLLGLQGGNEPDLYGGHGKRGTDYAPQDYFNDFGVLVKAMGDDGQIQQKNLLVAPSVCCQWSPEDVFKTGFLDTYGDKLTAIAVEHYPTNNCGVNGKVRSPQDLFPTFLNHTSAQSLTTPYANAAATAQSLGKPFLMFETNTASCGGFPGLSNSFGAAMWAADYALQMAYYNFTTALLHVGGQSEFYNPFTPPTTKSGLGWTIGPVYYSSLFVAEAFGNSGNAQIVDLNGNGGNIYTPAYAIYENGSPARLVLFNYVTDPSGANDLTVSVSIGGGSAGGTSSVRVRYLTSGSKSVSETQNMFWAGQTLGLPNKSDGTLQGEQVTTTIQCNSNTCAIPVQAASVALVFLTPDAEKESSQSASLSSSVTGKASPTSKSTATPKKNNNQDGATGSGAASRYTIPVMSTVAAVAFGMSLLFG